MTPTTPEQTRLKVCICGAVQGVGFRPFIFRLASELGLAGWVSNSAQGVLLEVEGPRTTLEQFLLRLDGEKPPRSFIQSLEPSWHEPVGHTRFEIRESDTSGKLTALVMPDLATCPECVRELFDPNDRRFRYPFINCTNCGPRFSIIEALPYDRANTSMRRFEMCPRCRAEYEDPANRRFHAEPIACPDCGPGVEFWDRRTGVAPVPGLKEGDWRDACPTNNDALLAAAEAIRGGRIVAVKGLGGFHLMADARNDKAVRRLRERKHREEKPFAVMFPSLDLVRTACEVSPLEERLLRSSESPIVLLKRRITGVLERWNVDDCGDQRPNTPSLHYSIASTVAPGNPNLGVLLPYTPLHHLLLAELGFPVVATSGNLGDEPICTDEREARCRLAGIADGFLVHDRPIVRHVDDSIVRVMLDRELVLRRARGYAPLPITIKSEIRNPKSEIVLAVGAHLKNTVALSVGNRVFLSQHIGDLETAESFAAFERTCEDLPKLYETIPTIIAADLHPDYLSTKHARAKVAQASSPANSGGVSAASGNAEPQRSGGLQAESVRYRGVQHHYAHVLACMAENEIESPALGVAWDGTGLGTDGTIWGGEFLRMRDGGFERVAHLRPFPLPGGDAAVREPRRSALGLLFAAQGDAAFIRRGRPPLAAFSESELRALQTMLIRGLNSPVTSSVGRLFDAVASLIGLRQLSRFEGQAAMEMEFAADGFDTADPFPFALDRSGSGALVLDWEPMLQRILKARCSITTEATADRSSRTEAPGVDSASGNLPRLLRAIVARFQVTLAEMIVAVAGAVGEERVALTGGCFQNRRLTELTVTLLRAAGFKPFWHQRVPPNDGGIALGQVVAAMRDAT